MQQSSAKKISRFAGGALLMATCLFFHAPFTYAADPVLQDQIPEPLAIDLAQKGIWGAIAFSPADGKRGIFWGADTRTEADRTALKYCETAGGLSCTVVTTFRNHRHQSDTDASGFPYEHCAALVVGSKSSHDQNSKWGAASGKTVSEATAAAKSSCGDEACKPVETVCI